MSWLMEVLALVGGIGLGCWTWWAIIDAQPRIEGVNEPGCKTRNRYKR